MDARGSRPIQRDEFLQLQEFRGLDVRTSNLDLEIPEKPENRTTTDTAFIFAYSIALVVTVAFVACTLVQYNNKDDPLEDNDTSSVDLTILEPHSTTFMRYLRDWNWLRSACGLLGVIIFAMIALVLMRYCTFVAVWATLLIGIVVVTVALSRGWYIYATTSTDKKYFRNILIGTVAVAVFAVLLFFLFRRITLVILLFREAALSLFVLPGLLLLTIIYSLSVLGAFAIFAVSEVYLHYVYTDPRHSTVTSLIALILNGIMLLWTVQFFYGFQCMVLGGAVSARYFAKDKRNLNGPIATSILNIFQFHLGSIFFGSLIIMLLMVIRILLSALIKNEKLKIAVESCMCGIGELVKYLTTNAYIETAMHGQPFWKSGKRAAKLFTKNGLDMIAVNYIGELVIAILVGLLLVLSAGVNYTFYKHEEKELIMFCLFCALITTYPVLIIFTTCVDTIFICFCEDREINDGLARPYCMTEGLMNYMDKSKEAKALREV